MTTITIEALWLRVHAILTVFADRVAAIDPALIRDLGHTANEAFLLRGHLVFRRRADGDEVAITIDVYSGREQVKIESDVCTGEGRAIATGPSVSVPLSETQWSVDIAIGDWLLEFDQFLLQQESTVREAVSQLA